MRVVTGPFPVGRAMAASLPGWLPGQHHCLTLFSLRPGVYGLKITGYGKGGFKNQAVIPGGGLFYLSC